VHDDKTQIRVCKGSEDIMGGGKMTQNDTVEEQSPEAIGGDPKFNYKSSRSSNLVIKIGASLHQTVATYKR
jgi:hypothetical protein